MEVKAEDFWKPFALYMLINVVLLLSWTLVAPLRWSRIEVMNYDTFGRSLESYGTCYAKQDDGRSSARVAFASTIVGLNLLVVLIANYQGYKARHVPSAFNETFYLVLSMAVLTEAILIGVPLIFLARDNPAAMFIIVSVLIFWLCLALLLPTFVSKLVIRRRETMVLNDQSMRRAWARYESRSRLPSSHENNVSSVEAIRQRVAQRAKEEESSGELDTNCASLTVEEIRKRAAQKERKEKSQQRITRNG